MNRQKLLDRVEQLRQAGQRHHDCTYINTVTGVKLCPAAPGGVPGAPCMCGADDHNASVDRAAKALAAEIEARDSELVYAPCPRHGRTAYEIGICPDCDENGEIKVPREGP